MLVAGYPQGFFTIPRVQYVVAGLVQNSLIRQSLDLAVFDQKYRYLQDGPSPSGIGALSPNWKLIYSIGWSA